MADFENEPDMPEKCGERKSPKTPVSPLSSVFSARHTSVRPESQTATALHLVSSRATVRRLWWIFGACQAGTSPPPRSGEGGGASGGSPALNLYTPPHSLCILVYACLLWQLASLLLPVGGRGGGSGRGNSGVEIEGGGGFV
jgi:hypothetical protein